MYTPLDLFSTARRFGCREASGPFGGSALRFDNTAGQPASDRLVTEAPALNTRDFTLSFWIRTTEGYGAWCEGESIPISPLPDRTQLPPEKAVLGGVIVSNATESTALRTGFSVTMLQQAAYLTVTLTPEGVSPIRITGIHTAADGRWHRVAISCCRHTLLRVFIDDEKAGETDISAYAGLSIGNTPLCAGADPDGKWGFGSGLLAEMHLHFESLPEEELKRRYYAEAVLKLEYDIRERTEKHAALYREEDIRAIREHAARAAANPMREISGLPLLRALKEEYDEFLLKLKNEPDLKILFTSDSHCEGEDGLRTLSLRRAFRTARRLGMDVNADAGDYSCYGKPYELDSYWNVIREEWNGRPLFVTPGNHETLELKAAELAAYHCGHLAAQGMVPEGRNLFRYEGDVKGTHFLVLAQYPEDYTVTGYKLRWRFAGRIPQEELDWLKDRLDACCGRGKPVFVIIHNALRPLMHLQTGGREADTSVILNGEGLYDVLRDHPEVIVCTGHVHHGFGICGLYPLKEEGYRVLDLPGIRSAAHGYGIGEFDIPGHHHGVYYGFLYGHSLLLRAYDCGTGEWMPEYDQYEEFQPEMLKKDKV